MTLDQLHFLRSDHGQRLLADLANTPINAQTHLLLASKLRKTLTADNAQAVLEMTLLRQKGAGKFRNADRMYFTRAALEQASAEPVAQHRAARFAALGAQHVVDMGCSIGGDALALAQTANVTGIDQDGVRLAMAQQNMAAYGLNDRFSPIQADLQMLSPIAADALFFDPARRDENGRRFFSVAHYRPPLSLLDKWRQMTPAAAAKISPGVDYAELPTEAEAEFVSLNGEVKEALLWYGALKTAVSRRATLLPTGKSITTADLPTESIPAAPPKSYLYEPDGAVIRAHLVEAVAAQIGATKIDAAIAYLSTHLAVDTPFARRYDVDDFFPFQLKRLRHYLREKHIGKVVIKKRGSPLEPRWLEKQLRLRGEKQCVLFLTQIQGEPGVIIGRLVD